MKIPLQICLTCLAIITAHFMGCLYGELTNIKKLDGYHATMLLTIFIFMVSGIWAVWA